MVLCAGVLAAGAVVTADGGIPAGGGGIPAGGGGIPAGGGGGGRCCCTRDALVVVPWTFSRARLNPPANVSWTLLESPACGGDAVDRAVLSAVGYIGGELSPHKGPTADRSW